MNPLRLVLVMPEPPLPFGHASARWYYLVLKGLLDRGHRVTAFCSATKSDEISACLDLFQGTSLDLRCYPHTKQTGLNKRVRLLRQPCSYTFSEQMRSDISTRLTECFDVLHLEQVWSGWIGLRHRKKSLLHVHNLWWVDLSHSHQTRLLPWLRHRHLFAAERRLVASYDNICCCSSRLQNEIERANLSARVDQIPAALDLAQYEYIPDDLRSGRPVITLIGNMSWQPTFTAAERLIVRLWPRIKKSVPDATLQIVGWQAKSLLHRYSDVPDLTIEENVKDTRPYFANSAVLLYAPERGSGMKIKVLEALAYGTPVITTSEGVEGIPALDGIHAGISDDDDGLVQRAVDLLSDLHRQNTQRIRGRKLLESECSAQAAMAALDPIYGRISGRELIA